MAIRSQRAAAAAGGNRTLRQEDVPESKAEAEAEADRTWAHQIKSALMANRFRLVQQPIASLVGEERAMFDLVVRMLDERGQEVLPSEFLTAAARTDLMKNIDRWVVGAAMSFCAARKPHKVFVRLSRDSLRDETLAIWLQQQLKSSRIEPGRVVIQVSEELATQHLKEAKALQKLLDRLGFEFAVENFGSGRDSTQLLAHVPVNYVKIDGSLMQGLANDRPLQERVKRLSSRRTSAASPRSPSAWKMRTRWPCSGSSASNSSRATSSTARKRSCCRATSGAGPQFRSYSYSCAKGTQAIMVRITAKLRAGGKGQRHHG